MNNHKFGSTPDASCQACGPGSIVEDLQKNRVAQRIRARVMLQTLHLREQLGVWEES